MKNISKKIVVVLMAVVLAFTFTACSSNMGETYTKYVQGLLDITYIGSSENYKELTESTDDEVKEIYDSGIKNLADSLATYYQIETVNEDIENQMTELAQNIYSKANYTVGEAYEVDGVYKIDVTVCPMDFLTASDDEVIKYVTEDFNVRNSNGDFADFTDEQYEVEYANGVISILENYVTNMGYKNAEVVTVTIKEDDVSYYVDESDLLNIDNYMIDIDGLDENNAETTAE